MIYLIILQKMDVGIFRGHSEMYLVDIKKFQNKFSGILRITGDCPLVDIEIINQVINILMKENMTRL